MNRGVPRQVLLVTTALFINYIDRGNLATTATLIQNELHLSASQLGFLLSAFYFTYMPLMPVMGWLCERYGARGILAASLFVWSVATLATGFAGSFATLLGLRLVLGVGESASFPCASKVLASSVSIDRLGVANGVMSFGYLLGPAVGTLVGGYLMATVGWRAVFIIFGTLPMLWLWPWLRTRESRAATVSAVSQPSFVRILRERGLWGAALGHFSSNYTYYFIASWLPFYLIKARGFSIGAMAMIAAWMYVLNAVSAVVMGGAADRLIRAGRSPTLVYKTIMGLSHVATVGCMIAMVQLPQAGSVAALFAFGLVSGCSYAGLFAIPQIIAGPVAAGRWVGVQNGVGNIAGLLAPAVTGMLVDQTGRFELAFAISAGVALLGAVGWVLILPAVLPLQWSEEGTTTRVAESKPAGS
jgi:MFS family permease